MCPSIRRVLSDVLTPVSAFHKIDDGGSACLFESVIGGEKVGRYSFLAAEPFLAARGAWHSEVTMSRDRARARSETRRPTIRSKCSASGCRRSAWRSCRDCRRSPAGRSATPATTRFATSSICRTHRHDDRQLRRSVVRVLRPHDRVRQRAEDGDRRRAGRRSAKDLRRLAVRRRLPPRRPLRRKARIAERRSAAGRHRHRRRGEAQVQVELHAGRVRRRGPQVRRVHSRRRHLSGRDQPAARGAALGRSVRSLSHAAGGEPEPVHVLPADARVYAGRQFAGDHGPRGRMAR